MNQVLKIQLDDLVNKYNVPEFAQSDPVGFPRAFSNVPDIEISALLTATIAWGNRKMIIRNAEKLHNILSNQPEHFVLHGDIDAIPDANIHRTFFGNHLRIYLRGLRALYSRYGTLENFAVAKKAHLSDAPAWVIASELRNIIIEANGGCADGTDRCLPANISASALKRLNMALRWLVRSDGIVDIGCWSAIKPDKLFIPLDVHSAGTARALGLLQRCSNDRKAVVELTENLRQFNPEDPTIYDFALFGAGIAGELPRK